MVVVVVLIAMFVHTLFTRPSFTVLTCSTHGWEFDASTGQGINPKTACLGPVAVKVEDGDILVDVSRAER